MPIVVPLPAGVSASDVVTGQTHACALTSNGVYCWGDGSMGQLGYGGTDTDVPPTLVTLPEVPVEITAGLQHTCALTERSGVYCWGSNASGQLIADLGSVVDAPARIVPATDGPIGVWAGGFTTCAWTNTGPLCAGRQTL
jgi:alpha-tubulin suppressor-like RCC1 family protein